MNPKTKTLIVLLATFMIGIVVGWFLENRLMPSMRSARQRDRVEFHQLLIDRLHLDQNQIALMDSILEMRKTRIESIKKQVTASRDTTNMEIKKILTPEQIQLYDQLLEELQKKSAKRKDHG